MVGLASMVQHAECTKPVQLGLEGKAFKTLLNVCSSLWDNGKYWIHCTELIQNLHLKQEGWGCIPKMRTVHQPIWCSTSCNTWVMPCRLPYQGCKQEKERWKRWQLFRSTACLCEEKGQHLFLCGLPTSPSQNPTIPTYHLTPPIHILYLCINCIMNTIDYLDKRCGFWVRIGIGIWQFMIMPFGLCRLPATF